jgi:predicted permease
MNMSTIIAQIGILFFAIALGFVGSKSGVMNEESNKHLSGLVVNLTLPCSILYSVMSNEHLLDNEQMVMLTGVAFLTVFALIALAALLVKVMKIAPEQIGVSKFMLIFTNSVFFGFPVIRVIFGSNAVFYAAVINMAFYLFCYTYGIMLVSNSKEKFKLRWKMLLTPMVAASLLSYVIYLLDIKVPAFLVNMLQFMDQVTSPLSMMTIGCGLAVVSLRSCMRAWRVYVALFVRMLIFPIIYFYLTGLLIDNRLILGVVTIVIAMPAPASTAMLCANYGGDQSVASSGVFFSTLLSLGTIPLLSMFLLN